MVCHQVHSHTHIHNTHKEICRNYSWQWGAIHLWVFIGAITFRYSKGQKWNCKCVCLIVCATHCEDTPKWISQYSHKSKTKGIPASHTLTFLLENVQLTNKTWNVCLIRFFSWRHGNLILWTNYQKIRTCRFCTIWKKNGGKIFLIRNNPLPQNLSWVVYGHSIKSKI